MEYYYFIFEIEKKDVCDSIGILEAIMNAHIKVAHSIGNRSPKKILPNEL